MGAPGNCVIFGHRMKKYGRHFNRLDELKATVALGNNEEILAALHKLVPTFRRPEEVNKNAEQVSAQCAKAKCCSVGVAI